MNKSTPSNSALEVGLYDIVNFFRRRIRFIVISSIIFTIGIYFLIQIMTSKLSRIEADVIIQNEIEAIQPSPKRAAGIIRNDFHSKFKSNLLTIFPNIEKRAISSIIDTASVSFTKSKETRENAGLSQYKFSLIIKDTNHELTEENVISILNLLLVEYRLAWANSLSNRPILPESEHYELIKNANLDHLTLIKNYINLNINLIKNYFFKKELIDREEFANLVLSKDYPGILFKMKAKKDISSVDLSLFNIFEKLLKVRNMANMTDVYDLNKFDFTINQAVVKQVRSNLSDKINTQQIHHEYMINLMKAFALNPANTKEEHTASNNIKTKLASNIISVQNEIYNNMNRLNYFKQYEAVLSDKRKLKIMQALQKKIFDKLLLLMADAHVSIDKFNRQLPIMLKQQNISNTIIFMVGEPNIRINERRSIYKQGMISIFLGLMMSFFLSLLVESYNFSRKKYSSRHNFRNSLSEQAKNT